MAITIKIYIGLYYSSQHKQKKQEESSSNKNCKRKDYKRNLNLILRNSYKIFHDERDRERGGENTYVCVCAHLCIHIYMYIYMRVYMYVCMYAYVSVCMHIYGCIRTHSCQSSQMHIVYSYAVCKNTLYDTF